MRYSFFRLGLIWFVAFILTTVSLGPFLANIKPLWILLFILYLQFISPTVFHLFWIISSGLLLDTLSNMPLGTHVFALCLVCWCANSRARRFKFFSVSQQLLWILVLSLIYQLSLASVHYILGYPSAFSAFFLPILSSLFIWPWIKYSMTSLLIGQHTSLHY